MDRISELPKEILQRILYFLSQQEAVRTSALFKSWRNIWCTRPNLDFSIYDFNGREHDFISVVNNVLQRYCDQRLCVEEFHLCIWIGDSDKKWVSLLEQWIPRFTIMGMKNFCLSISGLPFKLPFVVFAAESLQDLHVRNFVLDQKAIERIVVFKHLRSLHLDDVCIEDEIFEKIISKCPLIETLNVEKCISLRTIKVNHLHNLKYLFVSVSQITFGEELCRIEIYPPSLETIDISNGNLWSHKGADFRNLSHLSLYGVESPLDYLSSCEFPSLKYLKISRCEGIKGIDVFIDAPKINSFEYRGNFIPSISFATSSSSTEWDSEIQLTYQLSDVTSSWFLDLNELLKSLSQSNITLGIYQSPMDDDEHTIQENIHLVQDNGCNKPVVVESLSLHCDLSCFSGLLNCVFSVCHPRSVSSNYLYGYTWESEMEGTKYLWNILMQRESGNEDQLTQLLFRDLEEVSLEIYESNRELWLPTNLSELPNYRKQREYNVTRFALKWRETL